MIFVKIYMLSRYTTKCKYTLKMIQIITKLDGILSHILIMNWLYHFNYNWKFWFLWFHKKHLDKFFIQTSKSVLNYFFIDKLLSFERWQELSWRHFFYQNPFYMFIRMLDDFLKNCPQNIPKYTLKENIFLLKVPPKVCFHPSHISVNSLSCCKVFLFIPIVTIHI